MQKKHFLEDICQQRECSYHQLPKHLHISQQLLEKINNGMIKKIDHPVLHRLSEYLHYTEEQFQSLYESIFTHKEEKDRQCRVRHYRLK